MKQDSLIMNFIESNKEKVNWEFLMNKIQLTDEEYNKLNTLRNKA